MSGRIAGKNELTPDISPAQYPHLADRVTRMIIASMVTSDADKVESFETVMEYMTGKAVTQ